MTKANILLIFIYSLVQSLVNRNKVGQKIAFHLRK